MFLSTLKRGTAITVSTMLLASVAANATTVAPRNAARPASQAERRNATVTPGTEQVLGEGGTLAANYFGNLADIVGAPITCTTITTDKRDCASESSLPATFKTNPQILYAAIGTGGSQLDFVSQHSGVAGKTASTYPEFADAMDAYSNVSPYGYTSGWAGTAASSTNEDTIHFAAGDAPIPLGPSEGPGFVSGGFSVYPDSIAAYDGNGDSDGSGFNSNRGPAKVQPVVGTGVRIIFNTTNLTYPSSGLDLTQNELCGIFTGNITDWNQIPGVTVTTSNGSQPIRINYRADGSGTTFLIAYDLSQMCSFANPFHGTGSVSSNTTTGPFYWNQSGFSQGVGTDSKLLGSAGNLPPDSSAPETVWPYGSAPGTKSAGIIANVAAAPGAIGYVTPSDVLGANTDEAYVENYAGNYEQANTTTVTASLSSTTTSDTHPPAYPQDNKSSVLYFPFPTATNGDALVGYSYGYFYTCYPARLKDQVTGIKDLIGEETGSKTSATAATIAAFWNLSGMNAAELKLLNSAVGSIKTAAVTNPASYISPVDGSTKKYTCTDT